MNSTNRRTPGGAAATRHDTTTADTTRIPPPPAQPRGAQASQDRDHTVAVRPLAIAALNTTAIVGGAAFAVAGPAGLAVAAGALVAAPVLVASRRARSGRHSTGRVWPGRFGGHARSGRVGFPSLRSGRSVTPSRSTRGGSPFSGRSGGTPLRSTGNGVRPGRAPVGTTARSTTGAPTGRRTANSGIAPGSTAWRLGRRSRQNAAAAARAAREGLAWASSPRAAMRRARAAAAARAAGSRFARVVTTWIAGAVAYVATGLLNAGRIVFGTDVAHTSLVSETAPMDAGPAPPTVGTSLRHPTDQAANTNTRPSTSRGVPSVASTVAKRMIALSEELLKEGLKFSPEPGKGGMLDVLDMYDGLAVVFTNLAAMTKDAHAKTQGYPLGPTPRALVEGLHRNTTVAAQVAEQVPRAVRKVHAEKINDLTDAREAMWDHSANKGR